MGLFDFFKKKTEAKPVKTGVFVIDEEECVGCRVCENACPMDAIVPTKEAFRIEKKLCIACGSCVDECPMGCITQED